ncbi:MAG: hypothetical protein ACAH09_02315 [Methylophilaceae bacterium]
MKSVVAALLLGLAGISGVHAEEAKPDLLLIIEANEYEHEVRLGFVPHYIVWARKGPALERAARQAFGPSFSDIGMCKSNENADAVVWLQSQLSYNPMMMTYYAKVTARLYRSDGKLLETFTATGTAKDFYGSRLIETHVQTAYDHAMKDIAAQFTANDAAQRGIDRTLPMSPCSLVTLVPKL